MRYVDLIYLLTALLDLLDLFSVVYCIHVKSDSGKLAFLAVPSALQEYDNTISHKDVLDLTCYRETLWCADSALKTHKNYSSTIILHFPVISLKRLGWLTLLTRNLPSTIVIRTWQSSLEKRATNSSWSMELELRAGDGVVVDGFSWRDLRIDQSALQSGLELDIFRAITVHLNPIRCRCNGTRPWNPIRWCKWKCCQVDSIID